MSESLRTPTRVDIVHRDADGSVRIVVTARLAGENVLLAGSDADVEIVRLDAAERAGCRQTDGTAFLLALSAVYPPSLSVAFGGWLAVTVYD